MAPGASGRFARMAGLVVAVLSLAVMGGAGVFGVEAQGPPDPVQWSLSLTPSSVRPGGKILATLSAKIDPGWHLYSLTTPKGGPNPTKVKLSDNPAIFDVHVFEPAPEKAYDPNFKLDTETYSKEATILLEVALKKDAAPGPSQFEAQVRYQACQTTLCLPPRTKMAQATVSVDASAKVKLVAIPKGYLPVRGE